VTARGACGCTCCMCVYGWHDHCRFMGNCKKLIYHGRVAAIVYNAIAWLTGRWDQSALHDNRLLRSAVLGGATAGSGRTTKPMPVAVPDPASSNP
jgi:hypothetical protein